MFTLNITAHRYTGAPPLLPYYPTNHDPLLPAPARVKQSVSNAGVAAYIHFMYHIRLLTHDDILIFYRRRLLRK